MSKYSHCRLRIIGDKMLVGPIFIQSGHLLIGRPWNGGFSAFSFYFPVNVLF